MENGSSERLNIVRVLRETLRTYRRQARGLLGIGFGASVAGYLVGSAAIWDIAGYSATPTGLDPTVLPYTMTSGQWVVAGVTLLLLVVVLSCAGAASVITAGSSARLTIRDAFARVRPGPLQLFWLIWIVVILSSQFSKPAAPLLWFLIAPAIPMACIEELGPQEAVDRMWTLSKGSRLRLLLLEVVLCAVFPVVITLMRRYLVFSGRSAINFDRYPTIIRLPFALLATWVAATAAQSILVGLTCAFRELQDAQTAGVHA